MAISEHGSPGRPGHPAPERLERLLFVTRSLVAERDFDALLRLILDSARELTGARYAALGVLDPEKRGLERFIHSGIDAATAERIGPLPSGRGLLGELIRDPRPLRLDRISDHPRSYGFPAEHPPMTTFLGAPIQVRGDVYGNIYLTDKADGASFTDDDEILLVILADFASVAIDNARSHQALEGRRLELERAVRGLEAITSLSRELERDGDPARALELISKRARALVGARACGVLLADEAGLRIGATAGELSAEDLEAGLAEFPGLVEIVRTGTLQRLQAAALGASFATGGLGSELLVAPLRSRGRGLGALILIDRAEGADAFDRDDELVLGPFATTAAGLLAALEERADERARLRVNASEQERRRWARELHDETLQELGALKLAQLRTLELESEEEIQAALRRAQGRLDEAIGGLEDLITELRPAALDQLGAQAALEDLIGRFNQREAIEIHGDFDLAYESGRAETRHEPELEVTIYRLVQEALSNVVKHAHASQARVAVEERGGDVLITVEDDGGGLDPNRASGGFGLVGMRERVELADGSLEIGPGASGGTRVRAVLPVHRREPAAGELDR